MTPPIHPSNPLAGNILPFAHRMTDRFDSEARPRSSVSHLRSSLALLRSCKTQSLSFQPIVNSLCKNTPGWGTTSSTNCRSFRITTLQRPFRATAFRITIMQTPSGYGGPELCYAPSSGRTAFPAAPRREPRAERLMTIPAMGPIAALAWALEVVNLQRFSLIHIRLDSIPCSVGAYPRKEPERLRKGTGPNQMENTLEEDDMRAKSKSKTSGKRTAKRKGNVRFGTKKHENQPLAPWHPASS
jgi:hypothetical protein